MILLWILLGSKKILRLTTGSSQVVRPLKSYTLRILRCQVAACFEAPELVPQEGVSIGEEDGFLEGVSQITRFFNSQLNLAFLKAHQHFCQYLCHYVLWLVNQKPPNILPPHPQKLRQKISRPYQGKPNR